MSAVGYNGRTLVVSINGNKIAALRSKTVGNTRSSVDVTTDDSDGWQRLLPAPGVKAFNVSVAGVVTEGNREDLVLAADTFLALEVELPDGREVTAEDGFFLGDVQFTAEHDGAWEFTAELMSSGEVSIAPAP
jgi:predicted secreted protein